MNGPLAQIVALTCYGNAVLSGYEVESFWPTNSTCRFCDKVVFVTLEKSLSGKSEEQEVAKTPDAWFALLKLREATAIRLTRTPQNNPGISDRMSAAFVGGGGTWCMEILLPKAISEYWLARWEVGDQNAPDRKIWRVTYGLVSQAPSRLPEPIGLVQAAGELQRSLQEIRVFSAKHALAGFTRCFDDALDTLASKGKNKHGYHHDLSPQHILSEDAHMLLDACQKAWVFGGMGSWNDLVFEGDEQKEYDRASEQLFQAVNSVIEEAASSSMHFPGAHNIHPRYS